MNTNFFHLPRSVFSSFTDSVKDYWTRLSKLNGQHSQHFQKYLGRMLRPVSGGQAIFLDDDGTVLSWNPAFEKLERYKEAEILGQHFGMFYLPRERQEGLPAKLLAAAAEKGSALYRGVHARKDGSTFFGLIKITGIRNSRKQVIGFIAGIREISESDTD